MSERISKLVTCPKCGQQSPTDIMISGNTVDDGDLRDLVFSERIFMWKCKKCGHSTKYLHPFLYNDIGNRFMVYLIPKAERRIIADEGLEGEFRELSVLKKRVVPDVNSMKEKIILFERGINDFALELTKLAVADVVEKETSHNVYAGYFSEMDQTKNSISFQFFVGGEKRSYIQTTRLEVYKRSLDIVKKYFPREDRQQGFLNVGRGWAKSALERYKSSDK